MDLDAPAFVPTPEHIAELDRLGDEIALLSAHLDAATARLLDLIREFDARGGWAHGFRSCAAWLSWRVGLDPGAARERVRVARALGSLPRLAAALARGELSYAKLRALTRVATPETEERLLAVGRAGTAEQVERIVRGWRRVDRVAEARESARRHARRTLHVYRDDDGMVVIRGRLEPEVGTLLMRALDAARERLHRQRRVAERPVPRNAAAGEAADEGANGSTTPDAAAGHRALDADLDLSDFAPELVEPAMAPLPMEQQQADALGLLAEAALRHGLDPGAPGERYQVVVHVDAPVLANPERPGESVLEDGARVSAETSRRLACDASRVVMRHDAAGRIIEIGARTRTIPPALRRALQRRDHGCRFPGCGVRIAQGHHIRHWAEGGPTTLSNLALLCRRHHRAVHEEGYRVERAADDELRFVRPDGRPLPEVPEPVPVPDEPMETLRKRQEADGLRLHPGTGPSAWSGERLDVGWAIDVLHPLATGERASADATVAPGANGATDELD